ncbi:MAG: hypothetical protein IT427_18920 [Pirellulales bacterium]|nr:hypothetical protein [Pirellulales bacterium]
MPAHPFSFTDVAEKSTAASANALPASRWSTNYAERHRLRRFTDFPSGIAPPRKVRIYQRQNHFMLQWWDRQAKRTLSQRIEGDLLTALARARELDDRLELQGSTGGRVSRLCHDHLVAAYLADLERRANAQELSSSTLSRYRSALQHFEDFVGQPDVSRRYKFAATIDRTFRLEFTGYLSQQVAAGIGVKPQRGPRLKRPDYVLDVVRSMLQWARDPESGALLPESFRNPFVGHGRRNRQVADEAIDTLNISLSMAVDFVDACSPTELQLFAPLMLYGLRASEPLFLFREHLQDGWFQVPCLPELDYLTKGQREKRFPLVPIVQQLCQGDTNQGLGLVYERTLRAGQKRFAWGGTSLAELAAEFQLRCTAKSAAGAVTRQRIRDELLAEAGQVAYDDLEGMFRRLAQRLGWPRKTTLKDFRHLFSTCLEDAGVPEFYRKFLMGHSFGRAPIVT